MKKLCLLLPLLGVLLAVGKLQAQIPQDPLSFNHRAVLFGTSQAASDPVSSVMPGTAYGAGLGGYIDNPASIALLESGLAIEFGITYRSLREEVIYQGVANENSLGSSGLSNFNLLYSRGGEGRGLILAAGYTDHSVFDRTVAFNSFNDNSTITDLFKTAGSPYQGIARETGALVAGDESGLWFDSAFRSALDRPADFPGIRQQADIVQSGEGGELSFALATELQPGLLVGISMGSLSGSHHYRRVFHEVDDAGHFQSTENDTGGASIYSVTLEDQMESSFSGIRTRVGMVYTLMQGLTIGGSYTFPTTVTVEESLNASLRVREDRFNEENDRIESREENNVFDVLYPSMISLGAALTGVSGFSASLSFDYADYRQVRIDFLESELFETEMRENEVIRKEYAETLSIRGGIAWEMNEEIVLRAGYAVFPSVYLGGADWKKVISLGTSIRMSERIRLDFGARYLMTQDQSTIYTRTEYNYSNLTNGVPSSLIRNEAASNTLTQVLFTSNLLFRF